MKDDYTHVAVILDRTGSMDSIRDDTIGGFNAFLKAQKALPGAATLTLVQFDTQDPYEVIHRIMPIVDVPNLTRETYVPRASTPLLDAIGRGINDLEQCIAEMKDEDRPGRVVMVIVTDGQENSSREFRRDQIVKMMADKQEKSGWQFVFLSADIDSINDAVEYGVSGGSAMAYDRSAHGTAAAWGSLSSRTADYRSGKAKRVEFTDEDRKKQGEASEDEGDGKSC